MAFTLPVEHSHQPLSSSPSPRLPSLRPHMVPRYLVFSSVIGCFYCCYYYYFELPCLVLSVTLPVSLVLHASKALSETCTFSWNNSPLEKP